MPGMTHAPRSGRSHPKKKAQEGFNTPSYVIPRWPVTEVELRAFMHTIFGLVLPVDPCCPEHTAPWDVFADAYYDRSAIQVWKASRGFGGKSTIMGNLASAEALIKGAQSTVLGGSAAQSQRVQEVVAEGFLSEVSPRGVLTRDPTRYATSFKNGGWVRALMASQRSVRGPHPQKLRMDEIDEMELDILYAAMGQPMDRFMLGKRVPAHTIMSSTHQYPDKTMTAILGQALEKGWTVHEWSLGDGTLVATERGEVPIQHVTTNDRVLTRGGWRKVQHVTHMGSRECLFVELSNGRTIMATPDHRFAMGPADTPACPRCGAANFDGERCKWCGFSPWKRAEDLRPGDLLPGLSNPDALARPAVPALVAGGDVGVLRGELVPPKAVGECDLCGDVGGTSHVLPVGHVLQVVGVHAGPVPAEVVDLPTDLSPERLVSESVGEGLSVPAEAPGGHSVPVLVHAQAPQPAAFGGDNGALSEVGLVHRDPLRLGLVGAPLAPGGSTADGLLAVDAVHVVSVRAGAYMPVWDIGVEDEHEFVAEGVVVHNCYKCNHVDNGGWLTQEAIDAKKALVPAHMWAAEYDLQEPSFEGRAFDQQAVEDSYDRKLGVYAGAPDKYIEVTAPMKGTPYVTGVDWAKEHDWTVIRTFDTTVLPWREVAFERLNNRPWPYMIDRLHKRLKKYGGLCAHDATGIGNVVKDYMDWDDLHDVKVYDVVMNRGTRDALFNDYIAGVDDGSFRSPMIEFAYGEHRYVTYDDLFGKGHPPDSVVAGALAWSLRTRQRTLAAPVYEDLTKGSHWTSLSM